MLQDAEQRDPVTARRMQLLLMLWLHRYLTRAVLIQRIETILGYAAFGKKSWQDAFYRDMRVVKNAFHKAGYTLKYNRSANRPGYYLEGEPALHPDASKAISGAIAELDDAQITNLP